MDRLYKDQGMMFNIAFGTGYGALFGSGTGLLTALYQFSPSRTAPQFNANLIFKTMTRHSILFGGAAFAFTVGENILSSLFHYKPGKATLVAGSAGAGTVAALASMNPVTGFGVAAVMASGLMVVESLDWKMNVMSDEKRKIYFGNDPEVKYASK